MIKIFTLLFVVTVASVSMADSYKSNGKSLTKIEAVKLFLSNPKADVERCYPVTLNEKLNLVKVKVKK